jgi:hypothetical protein
MKLFHCTHLELSEGSIIQPGNWGKNLFEIGIQHRCWTREMVLEAVRSLNFPKKPSRLKSTFACLTLEAIKFYRTHHCPAGHIYEVEIIALNSVSHKGDFNAVEPLPRTQYNMWQIADLYWANGLKTNVEGWPNLDCAELVIDSPLKVIKRVLDGALIS